MIEQRKSKIEEIDPRDFKLPDEKPMSEMTWGEIEELYRSEGLLPPRPRLAKVAGR